MAAAKNLKSVVGSKEKKKPRLDSWGIVEECSVSKYDGCCGHLLSQAQEDI